MQHGEKQCIVKNFLLKVNRRGCDGDGQYGFGDSHRRCFDELMEFVDEGA
jgi:hypothetical protein